MVLEKVTVVLFINLVARGQLRKIVLIIMSKITVNLQKEFVLQARRLLVGLPVL